jgi:hypothetical protein
MEISKVRKIQSVLSNDCAKVFNADLFDKTFLLVGQLEFPYKYSCNGSRTFGIILKSPSSPTASLVQWLLH